MSTNKYKTKKLITFWVTPKLKYKLTKKCGKMNVSKTLIKLIEKYII